MQLSMFHTERRFRNMLIIIIIIVIIISGIIPRMHAFLCFEFPLPSSFDHELADHLPTFCQNVCVPLTTAKGF